MRAGISAGEHMNRLPLLLPGMVALLVGVLSGLARLGLDQPGFALAQAGQHGALMISAFLGTVISLERAVALGRGWPYLGPICSGLTGLALLAGLPLLLVQGLGVVAGVVLLAASVQVLRLQPLLHNATLALGALCWLVGGVVWFAAGAVAPAAPWWMAFLVLTIAGERLELTRFLPQTRGKQPAFIVVVAILVAGLLATRVLEAQGLALVAAALLALSAWLLRYDIARRTVRQQGLTRFMAVCLLTGYVWLAVGGLLGLAGGFVPGSGWRDAALHAVLLGFVFSMILGHAPIIFPAVARIKLPYHPVFYLPLLLLHGSLLLRLGAVLLGTGRPDGLLGLRQLASVGNGLALALFVATVVTAVLRARSHPGAGRNA